MALGIGTGALTYFVLDHLVLGVGKGAESRSGGAYSDAGPALALGAFLDGIPEQLVLGIGIAAGEGISVGPLVAIFVSNLPEAIGSASEMQESGVAGGKIVRLWLAVAVIYTLATVEGFAIADAAGGDFRAWVDGFAASALLVMPR